MADKMTRKELREPDALQRAGAQAWQWLQGKQRVLLIALGLAALALAGVLVADALNRRSEARSARQLGEAMRPLTREVIAEEEPEPNAKNPPFPTQAAKDEAIQAAMAQFRKSHGKGVSAATAALVEGQAAHRLGKYDEALSAFDAFLSASPSQEPLRASAFEGRGYAFEAKGELDKALEAFERLARENKTDFLAGMGMYHRARILFSQGKKQESAEAFSEVTLAHPESEAAQLAKARLSLLAADGVRPAPPSAATAGAPDAG